MGREGNSRGTTHVDFFVHFTDKEEARSVPTIIGCPYNVGITGQTTQRDTFIHDTFSLNQLGRELQSALVEQAFQPMHLPL